MCMSTTGNEDVRGFDVAMNDSLRVRSAKRVSDLAGEVNEHVRMQRFPVDQLLQTLPIQQLHYQECPPIGLANVVNRADVRMIER